MYMESINKLYMVQHNSIKHVILQSYHGTYHKHIETYFLHNTFISYIKYSLHIIHIQFTALRAHSLWPI